MKILFTCFINALPNARKMAWWILKVMLPLSFVVGTLQYFNLLNSFSAFVSPAFELIGLSGKASIAFISSVFISTYAAIGTISALNLDLREIIILGAMCVISHNMIVECAIQKKTGSNGVTIFIVRLLVSFASAIILNLLLPDKASLGQPHFSGSTQQAASYVDFLKNWAEVNGWLSLRIFCVILALLFLQNVLKEFKIIDLLSRTLAPVMGVMGLSRNVSFLWLVAQTLGLTYGAGILIEEINKGEITRSEANKLNYHLAISHSQFEDPMLFVAIGAPYFWVSLPRYVFSLLVVWIIVGIEHWRMKRLQRL
jgi:hypothetical protein